MSSWTGFCWIGFGMFHHPAWAVGSYSSGPPAGGTPKIKVNPTQVYEDMGQYCTQRRKCSGPRIATTDEESVASKAHSFSIMGRRAVGRPDSNWLTEAALNAAPTATLYRRLREARTYAVRELWTTLTAEEDRRHSWDQMGSVRKTGHLQQMTLRSTGVCKATARRPLRAHGRGPPC